MKKTLYSLLLFVSVVMLAQKNRDVKFAIANDIVGTDQMFTNYKDKVESTHFYKPKEKLPQYLEKFNILAEKGLTEIKLKKNAGTPDIIQLEALNEQYDLPKNTSVFIEGYEFDTIATKIYSEIILKIEVKDNNGQKHLYLFTNNY